MKPERKAIAGVVRSADIDFSEGIAAKIRIRMPEVVGIAKRDIAKGESILVTRRPDGTMSSEAIEFRGIEP